MVLSKLKLILINYMQSSHIFPVKHVPPCEMRNSEIFNNRVEIEIPVYDTPAAEKADKPDAILRGILCKSIMHNAPTIICAMGQTQNVEEARDFIPMNIFHHVNIVLVNYRGYGITNGTALQKARGSTGIPSAEALQKDILRVYDHVKCHFGMSNFYGVGVSLGTSIITYLSKHRKLKGQLLITPFDSMVNTALDFIKHDQGIEEIDEKQVKDILKHKFDSIVNMRSNKTPTYVIRAGADTFVKPERTENLVKHVKNLRSYIVIEHAQHNFGGENPHVLTALRLAIGSTMMNFLIDAVQPRQKKASK